MSEKSETIGFVKATGPILRKVIENIENPFVWMPLGLFILCVLAYPITKFQPFLYISIAFVVLAFFADWLGRIRNRSVPKLPALEKSSYRDKIFGFLAKVQKKAITMLQKGKLDAARSLTNKNLMAIVDALKAFPDDAGFHSLMGYTLKDMFQSANKLLLSDQCPTYLLSARKAFEKALTLDSDNASAHNGMGNVLFFEGDFDMAIKEYDAALKLSKGNYPAAHHDRRLAVKAKEDKKSLFSQSNVHSKLKPFTAAERPRSVKEPDVSSDNAFLKRVAKAEVNPGDELRATTTNSTYHIRAAGFDSFVVSGGWFAKQQQTRKNVGIWGCSWGDGPVDVNIIAALGMCIQYANGLITIEIKRIRIKRYV